MTGGRFGWTALSVLLRNTVRVGDASIQVKSWHNGFLALDEY
jgi:hypothetical protein